MYNPRVKTKSLMTTEPILTEKEPLAFTIRHPQSEQDNADVADYIYKVTRSIRDITPKRRKEIEQWVKDQTVLIAYNETDEIIGCVGYYEIPFFYGIYQLVSLYIDAEYRGRKHPESDKTTGEALFESVLEEVQRESENPTLIVETTTPKLQTMCESLDFCYPLSNFAPELGRPYWAYAFNTVITAIQNPFAAIKGMKGTTGEYKAYYLTPATITEEI